MNNAIEVRDLTRRHKSATALDAVTVSFEAGVIHGLLGRNGAGKTSLMSIASGQDWPTSGQVSVFGERPHENEQVLPRICFVREDQKYIEDSLARHAFAAAAMAYPNWDRALADRLVEDFRVPARTRIKKMSRGQRSAVAVIIGIASRAELTFFDEPVDSLRGRAVTLIGAADTVRELTDFRQVLHTESLGRLTRTTVLGALEEHEQQRARSRGVEVIPVSLQQLIVHLTSGTVGADRDGRQTTTTTTTPLRTIDSEVAS